MATVVAAQMPMDVIAKNSVISAIGGPNVEKVEVKEITEGDLVGKQELIIKCFLPKEHYYNGEEALTGIHAIYIPVGRRLAMDKTFDNIQMVTVITRGKRQERIVLKMSLLRYDIESINWQVATPDELAKIARANGEYCAK